MNNSKLSGLLACVGLLGGCTKEKLPPAVVLTGKVELVTEFGTPVVAGSGISTESIQVKTAVDSTATDPDGRYKVRGASRAQTLTFAKTYIGTYRMINYLPQKGQEVPLVKLGVRPSYTIASAYVKVGADSVYVQGVVGTENIPGLPPRRHRLFFQSGPVSPLNYSLSVGGETNIGNNRYIDAVPFSLLRAAGLLPGTPIQLKVYADNAYADTYLDSTGQKLVYPAVSYFGSNNVIFTY
ncbi:hypothetical protein [Hymenobacter psychrophilus]|uniref:Uncharacterized protein n=1 Tax=Hymenobacter psychrophilus TaxID=651662 RepID=A0A1H3KLY7_9BACT|nr:hypothetical protein [Hymenobacter psychrophilus]SDY53060.1 hypothetical protein SAMN04488069_109184 [Hymenobacter psychrophilus]